MATASPGDQHISIALRILGVIGILFGLSLALAGIYLITLGGSWYYTIIGLMTAAGWSIFRGLPRGVAIYLLVCLITVIWALWEVWGQSTWFWPLIPRLFAFAFALFFILLAMPLMPAYRGDPVARRNWLLGALVVLIGLGGTVAGMFAMHGVVRNGFTLAGGTTVNAAALAMGGEWHNYGRTTTATRFAPADQITKDNVGQLEVAWTYRTGIVGDGTDSDQNTPVYANGTVYSCTFNNQVHAIDGVTGARKWVYDPKVSAPYWMRCRGVTYYATAASADGTCAHRIALGTLDARLISLDADTGLPCKDFGAGGAVNLMDGMGGYGPGLYMETSAPTVARGKIIVGGLVDDNYEVGEPSGVVRAYDGATGQLAWAFDVGRPGRYGVPEAGRDLYALHAERLDPYGGGRGTGPCLPAHRQCDAGHGHLASPPLRQRIQQFGHGGGYRDRA